MTSTSQITIAACNYHNSKVKPKTTKSWSLQVKEVIDKLLPKGESKGDQANVIKRRIFTMVCKVKYPKKSLNTIAFMISRNYGINQPTHATVIHAFKKHNDAISFKHGHKEYIEHYEKVLNYLLAEFLITNKMYDALCDAQIPSKQIQANCRKHL